MREDIANILGIDLSKTTKKITYQVLESVKADGYTRHLINYEGYDSDIIAYLLIPDQINNNPAILINHQHNGERHLGKSEVCGLVGDPFQAFGPKLAQLGYVVLAPDSICFEERRIGFNQKTIANQEDYNQHFNHMCYLIVKGKSLASQVIGDAINSISLLYSLDFVNKDKICTVGHSYGGNTTLFLAALDQRIKYSCVSGSGASYQNRIDNGVGIEMASVIPGFASKYEISDLVSLVAPRTMVIVAASDDKFSADSAKVYSQAQAAFLKLGAFDKLTYRSFNGKHPLTKERFDYIIDWFSEVCKK